MKILYILLLMIISTTGQAGYRVPAAEQAIAGFNRAMQVEMQGGDAAALLEQYTSDAIMLPPSSEILNGTTAIEAYWHALRNKGIQTYTVYPVELRINGTTAYFTGIWEALRISPSGESITLEGNLSNVLQQQVDGSWKIQIQSWN